MRYACPWMDRWNLGVDVCCLPQLFLFLETGCLAVPGDHCIAYIGCLGISLFLPTNTGVKDVWPCLALA